MMLDNALVLARTTARIRPRVTAVLAEPSSMPGNPSVYTESTFGVSFTSSQKNLF
jgi:hypothetical protein